MTSNFNYECLYSRLSRSFPARGSVSGVTTKGISIRVTKLSQRYNKNTCLTSVKHSFISSLHLAAVLRSGEAHENNFGLDWRVTGNNHLASKEHTILLVNHPGLFVSSRRRGHLYPRCLCTEGCHRSLAKITDSLHIRMEASLIYIMRGDINVTPLPVFPV